MPYSLRFVPVRMTVETFRIPVSFISYLEFRLFRVLNERRYGDRATSYGVYNKVMVSDTKAVLVDAIRDFYLTHFSIFFQTSFHWKYLIFLFSNS